MVSDHHRVCARHGYYSRPVNQIASHPAAFEQLGRYTHRVWVVQVDAWSSVIIEIYAREPEPRGPVHPPGLRGIAAIFVVASHTSLYFATFLIPLSIAETGKPTLFQRPFFRLVIQGQAWVAMFFILLGFVNSLKPLQLARSGAVSEALGSLSTGAFRRTGRLVFPATLVTFLTWLSGCLLAEIDDAKPSVSLVAAVEDLVRELAGTWLYGENAYDQPQWALLPLFRGSLYFFMTLFALINTTPQFRLCAKILHYIWSWATLDANNCQISASLKPRSLFRTIPYGVVILGVSLCSFPDQYAEQTAWSSQLSHIGDAIFPEGSNMSRYFASVGAQMVCSGVILSPSLRQILSNRVFGWDLSVSPSIYCTDP
ncbi:hypothetical protein N7533_007254 [Penicillium manginii]|uniref:uncharacterized protein n=1 Tax=Penicillium manginii TaxID=203109 RepID=UPI002548C9AB|nr:uncharacterized protein N7533_007254 [Penicillium manginii]KAJ5750226.1 hypothetical protein N7533_007254 [Penicillium manginii]